MNKPPIYTNRRVFSASSLIAALGDYLGKARVDHGMTFTDLGETLGKGDDAAARYVAGADDLAKLSPIARALSAVADATRPGGDGGSVISDEELKQYAGEIAAGFAIFRELHDRSIAVLTKGAR